MRVWVVIHQDWDTEGNASLPQIVGVFSSESKIPTAYKEGDYRYESYNIVQCEVDAIPDRW